MKWWPKLVPLVLAAGALAALPACSPTLNWREIAPDDAGLNAMFPCRPDRFTRAQTVAGASVQMQMLVCDAGGATYALSFFDTAAPAATDAALLALRDVAARNIGAAASSVAAFRVPGMTPREHAARLVLRGRLPDGSAVQEQAAFFAKGLRVYQATTVSRQPAAEGDDVFFGGLRFVP